MDQKGYNAKRLAELTGITEGYVRLLLEGNLTKLPPAPYVRGYLSKIAPTLDLDRDDLWHRYLGEANGVAMSGADDRLPRNRFALKTGRRWMLVTGLAVLMIAAVVGWNTARRSQTPALTVLQPSAETSNTFQTSIIIAGQTDQAAKLTVNDEQLYVDRDGRFQKEYSLQEGLNTFEIAASKFLGGQTKILRTIIRQEPPPPAPEATPTTTNQTTDQE